MHLSTDIVSKPQADGDGSLVLPSPYLLFLGDADDAGFAKTGLGLRDWAPEKCLGEYALPGCSISTGLPAMTPEQAVAGGAQAMVIGVANAGGFIPDSWRDALQRALVAGLDLISGLHSELAGVDGLASLARSHGRHFIEVRRPPTGIPVGTGRRRSGKRLLTVGTDCALGKKYTALTLARAMRDRGIDTHFRATGQTGIMIAGSGIPLDAVIADFAAGAAEALSPDADKNHWDVIEGQGSLFHPAYSGVSLALLHGSQPDVFVVCDNPVRKHMLGLAGFPVPRIEEVIELTIALGRRTNAGIRCAGISLDTSMMGPTEAERTLVSIARRTGLPAADPVRGGERFAELVAACVAGATSN